MSEDFETILNWAYFYLKFRPRTEKEIVDYLNKKITKKNLPKKNIEKVIRVLKEQGLVDDRRFIEWLVDQRSRFRPRGVFGLKTELIRYGVDEKEINDFFNKNQIDEKALIDQYLERYLVKKGDTIKTEKGRERMVKHLLRRGFSYQSVKSALAKRFKKD